MKEETIKNIFSDIDAAYQLIHAMASAKEDFSNLETASDKNFEEGIKDTNAKQIIT